MTGGRSKGTETGLDLAHPKTEETSLSGAEALGEQYEEINGGCRRVSSRRTPKHQRG